MKTSLCCGASPEAFLGPHGTIDSDSTDFGICPSCGDHCEFVEEEELVEEKKTMALYKCVSAEIFENDEAINVVNVDDEKDWYPADPDSLVEGNYYSEAQLEFKNAPYVYDNGVGNAVFAFSKDDITNGLQFI